VIVQKPEIISDVTADLHLFF